MIDENARSSERRDRTRVVATLLATTLATTLAHAASGQMPGAPTLQNAFAAGGVTVALDASTMGRGSTYAGAFGWSPASGRFQLSGGVGAQLRSGGPSHGAYGVRANLPVYGASGGIGASIFGGYGAITGKGIDSTMAKSLIPIGATISYRSAGATGRGLSVYGSPIYEWVTRGDSAKAASVLRGAVGLDLGLTPSLGVTVGVELGAKYDASTGKPSGTAFGIAASYALGRHR